MNPIRKLTDAIQRYLVQPLKNAANRVADLFRSAPKKEEPKKEPGTKWTSKFDLDMVPLLPDGPRPVGPLPSDPAPAYRAIPNEYVNIIIAGQRQHLPHPGHEHGGLVFEGGKLAEKFDMQPVARVALAANDLMIAAPAFKVA